MFQVLSFISKKLVKYKNLIGPEFFEVKLGDGHSKGEDLSYSKPTFA